MSNMRYDWKALHLADMVRHIIELSNATELPKEVVSEKPSSNKFNFRY